MLGAATIVRFPLGAYGAALTGYQRFDVFNACQALESSRSPSELWSLSSPARESSALSVAYGAARSPGGTAYA